MNLKQSLIIVAFFGLNVTVTNASSPVVKNIPPNLCIEYSGTFLWDEEDPETQNLRVRFSNINYGLDGRITAYGGANYSVNGKLSYSEVKVLIDRKSHRFEMWESNSNDPEFVTDGSHIGRISGDFSKVEAIWTTNKTGSTGKLQLKALDSCSN